MKVNPLTSVGAKLFYLMTVLVVITVAGNSYQFFELLLKFQKNQVSDTIVREAEKSSAQIEQSIENLKSQIGVALPTLRGVDKKKSKQLIQNFVDSNEEFLSFEILEAPTRKSTKFKEKGGAFTRRLQDHRFEGKIPSRIKSKIGRASRNWLKKRGPKTRKDQKIIVQTLSKKTRLPVMVIASRFDVAGSSQVVWAVLVTWQSKLIAALPKSKFITSSLVDDKARVFSSHTMADMLQGRKLQRSGLVKMALAGLSPSGAQDIYLKNDRRTLGAFSRLQKYDLTVLIEQDAQKAYDDFLQNMVTTGLIASLFILVAILFSFLGAAGITKSLRAVSYATGRIASGDFKYQIRPRSRDEVGVLSVNVNQMSRKIINLMNSQVDKARFEKELETARMVQSTFFPKQDINSGHLSLSGFYQPASECGGDLWGHFNVAEGVDFVFIADATGHGAPAALVTAIAYSTTMAIGDMIKSGGAKGEPPSVILDRLNRIIYDAVGGKICMTFFGCMLDTNKGEIVYANAGHNFPILLPNQAKDDRAGKIPKSLQKLSDIPPISLKLKGTPLGMDPTSKYKDKKMQLRPGDKIFFFTDGLIECQAPNGEVWGRKILLEHVVENAKQGATPLKDEVLARAFTFFNDHPLDDDVTVVVAEVGLEWTAQAAPTTNSQDSVSASSKSSVAPALTAQAPPPAAAAEKAPAAPLVATPPPPPAARSKKAPGGGPPPPPVAPSVAPSVPATASAEAPAAPEAPVASQQPSPAPGLEGQAQPAQPKRGGKFKIKLPNAG